MMAQVASFQKYGMELPVHFQTLMDVPFKFA